MRIPFIALILSLSAACEIAGPIAVEAEELCSQPVLRVTTDVTGTDPDALCDTETGDCLTLRAAFKSASFCVTQEPKIIELLPGAVYELMDHNPPAEFATRLTDQTLDRVEGRSGLPLVRSVVHLQGEGATIRRGEGAPMLRLLQVVDTGSLLLEDLILEGGGSALHGGAIYNEGDLEVRDTLFTENVVQSVYWGGAIYNAGHLLAGPGTIFSRNDAGRGAAVYQDGSDADSSLDHVLISNNGAPTGTDSVVFIKEGAQLRIAHTVLEANSTSNGAVHNGGDLTIDSSTFTGNTAVNAASLRSFAGNVTIERSTFSDETASSAISCGGLADQVTLQDVTVYRTTAGYSAILAGESCVLRYTNTVVAENTPRDCAHTAAPVVTGANMDTDGTCTGFTTVASAGLEALSDNGGFTLTHQPQASSALIDAGGTSCLGTDQRGEPRPAGGACDVGAVER